MKIFCCYSKSHVPLYERHFHASLPANSEGGPFKINDYSVTGEFESEGFQRACRDKVATLVRVLEEQQGQEPFIFSDVDVRFYGDPSADLLRCLGDADMAFQDDGPAGACTGFMVIRPTAGTLAFWQAIARRMAVTAELDQDAVNRMLEADSMFRKAWIRLPERYWTFGRTGQHWTPGMPVDPPTDLLVHHANWTSGIANKLALLEEVFQVISARRGNIGLLLAEPVDFGERVVGSSAVQLIDAVRPVKDHALPIAASFPHGIERDPRGATVVAQMLVDQERRRHQQKHHPMSLALVLQFWQGDKREALRLARLIADVEREFRDDVVLVLVRQSMVEMDKEIWDTSLYCGRKMPVCGDFVTKFDDTKPYPGVCFDPWASACQQLSDAYHTGKFPYHSGFFFEPDGCPMSEDWIDRIKLAHDQTLLMGKRITGPRSNYRGMQHINGSLVMHWSCWEDHPSLHRAPPDIGWDIFHGQVMLAEAGPSPIIRGEYGAKDITETMWRAMAAQSAWLTSVKDSTHHHWARRILVEHK